MVSGVLVYVQLAALFWACSEVVYYRKRAVFTGAERQRGEKGSRERELDREKEVISLAKYSAT